MTPRKTSKQKSIQGDGHKRGQKHLSYASQMNAKTLKTAYRHQTPWTEDDVRLLVSQIEADNKTVDMAIALERTFYSISVARSHTAFAMRWQHVIVGHHVPAKESKTKPHPPAPAPRTDELAAKRKTTTRRKRA